MDGELAKSLKTGHWFSVSALIVGGEGVLKQKETRVCHCTLKGADLSHKTRKDLMII
jgi:hypothetical protein